MHVVYFVIFSWAHEHSSLLIIWNIYKRKKLLTYDKHVLLSYASRAFGQHTQLHFYVKYRLSWWRWKHTDILFLEVQLMCGGMPIKLWWYFLLFLPFLSLVSMLKYDVFFLIQFDPFYCYFYFILSSFDLLFLLISYISFDLIWFLY